MFLLNLGYLVRSPPNHPRMGKQTFSPQHPVKILATLVLAAGLLGIGAVGYPANRTIDGTENNLEHPTWGCTNSQLLRLTPADYGDQISSPAGGNRVSPRMISNTVNAQSGLLYNTKGATDFVWQWGQFIDHDLGLTEAAQPPEPFDIPMPAGDPFFDPYGECNKTIPLNRSVYDPDSAPRQQINQITAFIDASNVYGSDRDRAAALRMDDESGRLNTSAGDLLPFNTDGLPNQGGDQDSALFLAGDVRANEQVALTALHTLFVREHNRLADQISRKNPQLSGEEIYQKARALVGAQLQVITYQEFLPILLGRNGVPNYKGYDPEVNSGISNLFSTAAFRVGHSMLPPMLLRLDNTLNPIAEGNLALRNAFFAPERIVQEGGIDPILIGLATQVMQDVDPWVIDEVRNFLFGPPGSGGFDLASLNIQRGRDHGLPSYNTVRAHLGLPRVRRFAEITSNVDLQYRLRQVYGDVDNIDVWVGGLAEDKYRDALVGETFHRILKDQFQRLRDGDRFWYENVFTGEELRALKKTTLAQIIRRNTLIRDEIQDNVFRMERARGFVRVTAQPFSPVQTERLRKWLAAE